VGTPALSRVPSNLAKRSNFERRDRDAYLTWDTRAVPPLLPHLGGLRRFVEPCAGAGHLVDQLEAAGLVCVQAFDIHPLRADVEVGDAMRATLPPGADGFISNPPWKRRHLHPIIGHLARQAPTWLLFDAGWAFSESAAAYLELYCHAIVPTPRLQWVENTEYDATDDTAWYFFGPGAPGAPRLFPRA
jgi:hypothetical protein